MLADYSSSVITDNVKFLHDIQQITGIIAGSLPARAASNSVAFFSKE